MTEHSRRGFLKATAAATTLATAAARRARALDASASQGGGVNTPAPQASRLYLTDAEHRYVVSNAPTWRPVSSAAPLGETVVLYPERAAQSILGFGAAMTDSACYNISQMPAGARAELMHQFFSPSEMGFSVCRTCVGSSDYARTLYSFDEGAPDPGLQRFSIAHDEAYILPTLRQARRLNPELFLLSSPWSPPNWMKSGDTMLGGTISRHLLPVYAQYMVKFLQAYQAAGVEINAITPQNEVDTDQDHRMPACLFPQEIEVAYVGQHLGPALRTAGLKTEIWLIDHNYNLWGRAICELDDPQVRNYTDSIAWHGYVGKPEWMQKVVAAHPEVKMYWTEGGPDITAPDYATDWAKWSETFTGVLRNGPRCIIAWNLVLDENGKPNIGPFSCGGVATVNSHTKKVTYSGQYYAFNHYARTMRRGARVIASEGGEPGLSHVAARNSDGGYALVLTNTTASPRRIAVRNGAHQAELVLPADSVSTLAWS